ncbi:hypothetical protein GCM10023078_06200 [Gibbsiella greigii]
MKFYKNSDGYLKVEADESMHLVSSFLEHDVQNSVYGVDEYLSACDSVSNGDVPRWEGTGNAHTVTIKKNGVNIYNEYTNEEMNISTISEFKKILENWKKLILEGNSLA